MLDRSPDFRKRSTKLASHKATREGLGHLRGHKVVKI